MATSTCAEDGVAYSLVCGLGYITLFEFHHVDPWGCARMRGRVAYWQ